MSLAQQVMLIVAIGLVIAQAVNLGLLVRERQAFSLEAAAAPAISRLVDALDAAEQGTLSERRGRSRMRVRISAQSRVSAETARLPDLEALVLARLKQDTQLPVRGVQAALMPTPRGNTGVVISVQTEAGQWLTARARGPAPIGPVIGDLAVQTLVILAALLVPLLLLVRNVTRPLSALARDADNWAADGGRTTQAESLHTMSAPRDVRDLIGAVGAMKARIGEMLREKDVMLGAIGHDLRTPLTALRIQVELIDDAEQRAGLRAEIERLSGDLEGMLTLARSPANMVLRHGDLVSIARQVADEFRARGAEIEVEERLPLAAMIDEAAIRRALANLVDNAVRYSGKAQVLFERRDELAVIVVEDDGPGIPETLLESAAHAFVRIEPSRNRDTGGHGLGLAIVSAIVRRHGGTLRLSNRREGGLRAEMSIATAERSA